MADVGFSCRCGHLAGHITGLSARTGTRLLCHCSDCTRSLRHYGIDADQDAGVDLIQTSPERVVIDTGADQLGVARLSPRGLLRWYATCCGTPLFNTLSTPALPLASVQTSRLSDPDACGPAVVHAFRKMPDGSVKTQGVLPLLTGFLGRALKSRMTGAWKAGPFFDARTKLPVVDPELLPADAGRG
ncbi:MAG: DUF6151 family protein [Roseicyclus sp.]